MIEIITMKSGDKYEVVHIYKTINDSFFSEDLINRMKKNCDVLLRNGSNYFACNKIEDAIYTDINIVTFNEEKNTQSLQPTNIITE